MANSANEDPRNVPLERENPDLLASPYTDSGTIPNLKFSFTTARNRLITGGWARDELRGQNPQRRTARRSASRVPDPNLRW
jgi:oxalate decarboxylase